MRMVKILTKAWKVRGGWVAIAISEYKCEATDELVVRKRDAIQIAKDKLKARLVNAPEDGL
jgi:hypothetical protein